MNCALTITEKAPAINNLDIEYLMNMPMFKDLSYRELQLIEKTCILSKLKRGKVIYTEGRRHTGIYAILSGVVKISKNGPVGKDYILKFAHKGDVVAYRSLLTNEVACTSAKVIEEAVVCHIHYNILLLLFERNWQFRQEMMKMMCKEVNESNLLITEIAYKSVRERTAELLLYLYDEFGLTANKTLNIKITRVELANKLGSSSESVVRMLGEFKSDGLIDLNGKEIRLINLKKLREISDFEKYRHSFKPELI